MCLSPLNMCVFRAPTTPASASGCARPHKNRDKTTTRYLTHPGSSLLSALLGRWTGRRKKQNVVTTHAPQRASKAPLGAHAPYPFPHPPPTRSTHIRPACLQISQSALSPLAGSMLGAVRSGCSEALRTQPAALSPLAGGNEVRRQRRRHRLASGAPEKVRGQWSNGQRHWRLWAGTRAPPRPLLGTHAARRRGGWPCASGRACGAVAVGGWVGGWAGFVGRHEHAARCLATMAVLPRSRVRCIATANSSESSWPSRSMSDRFHT